jgi:hypothetical protein
MMAELLANRWAQLVLVGILTALLGTAIGSLVFPRGSSGLSLGLVRLTTGGSVFISGDGSDIGVLGEIFEEDLPLTASEAVAAGWRDPILCSQGRGKYFQKSSVEETPYVLMYSSEGHLIGLYMFSRQELPAPWERTEQISGGGGTRVIDYEHWGLFVYFQDPTRACKTTEAGKGSGAPYGGPRTAVKSTPTPYVAPTPTPTPGDLLTTAAALTSEVSSLTFDLSIEPEGASLIAGLDAQRIKGKTGDPGLQVVDAAGVASEAPADSLPPGLADLGATVGGIALALQDPAEAARQWIDNVPSRGISGTVAGADLSDLVPSAPADARVNVTVWVGEKGFIRLIHIEGPVTAGDPAGAVRVLKLSGFGE